MVRRIDGNMQLAGGNRPATTRDVRSARRASLHVQQVLVATADAATRTSLLEGIATAGLGECASVRDSLEAVGAARSLDPALALVDMALPGGCIAAVQRIVGDGDIPVVVVTRRASEPDLIESVKAGANGYLELPLQPAALAGALLGVLAGEAAVPRSLTRLVLERFRRTDRLDADVANPAAALSDRERVVLRLLGEGCTTAEIGERLYIAAVTVRSHVAAVLHKLQVADRAEAVALMRTWDRRHMNGSHPPDEVSRAV